MIRIVAIGKRHESWVREGIERYEKRLVKPYDTQWVFLPHSARENQEARADESSRILDKLSDTDYVVLLDETGAAHSTPTLSLLLSDLLGTHRTITIVIGGAYGVDQRIKSRAGTIISLSNLVFPHQLVRLILAEQLYRSQSLAAGHPYHHA